MDTNLDAPEPKAAGHEPRKTEGGEDAEKQMYEYYRIVDIIWALNPDSSPEDIKAERAYLWPYIDIEDCEKFFSTAKSNDLFENIKQFYQAKHHHVIACARKIYVEKDGVTTSHYEEYHDPAEYKPMPPLPDGMHTLAELMEYYGNR